MENLNKIFEIIADTLKVSIEVVKSNAPVYIMKYGRYCFIDTLWEDLIKSIIMGVACGGVVCIIYMMIEDMEGLDDLKKMPLVRIFTICILLSILLLAGKNIFLFVSDPQMYGLTELLKLIK